MLSVPEILAASMQHNNNSHIIANTNNQNQNNTANYFPNSEQLSTSGFVSPTPQNQIRDATPIEQSQRPLRNKSRLPPDPTFMHSIQLYNRPVKMSKKSKDLFLADLNQDTSDSDFHKPPINLRPLSLSPVQHLSKRNNIYTEKRKSDFLNAALTAAAGSSQNSESNSIVTRIMQQKQTSQLVSPNLPWSINGNALTGTMATSSSNNPNNTHHLLPTQAQISTALDFDQVYGSHSKNNNNSEQSSNIKDMILSHRLQSHQLHQQQQQQQSHHHNYNYQRVSPKFTLLNEIGNQSNYSTNYSNGINNNNAQRSEVLKFFATINNKKHPFERKSQSNSNHTHKLIIDPYHESYSSHTSSFKPRIANSHHNHNNSNLNNDTSNHADNLRKIYVAIVTDTKQFVKELKKRHLFYEPLELVAFNSFATPTSSSNTSSLAIRTAITSAAANITQQATPTSTAGITLIPIQQQQQSTSNTNTATATQTPVTVTTRKIPTLTRKLDSSIAFACVKLRSIRIPGKSAVTTNAFKSTNNSLSNNNNSYIYDNCYTNLNRIFQYVNDEVTAIEAAKRQRNLNNNSNNVTLNQELNTRVEFQEQQQNRIYKYLYDCNLDRIQSFSDLPIVKPFNSSCETLENTTPIIFVTIDPIDLLFESSSKIESSTHHNKLQTIEHNQFDPIQHEQHFHLSQQHSALCVDHSPSTVSPSISRSINRRTHTSALAPPILHKDSNLLPGINSARNKRIQFDQFENTAAAHGTGQSEHQQKSAGTPSSVITNRRIQSTMNGKSIQYQNNNNNNIHEINNQSPYSSNSNQIPSRHSNSQMDSSQIRRRLDFQVEIPPKLSEYCSQESTPYNFRSQPTVGTATGTATAVAATQSSVSSVAALNTEIHFQQDRQIQSSNQYWQITPQKQLVFDFTSNESTLGLSGNTSIAAGQTSFQIQNNNSNTHNNSVYAGTLAPISVSGVKGKVKLTSKSPTVIVKITKKRNRTRNTSNSQLSSSQQQQQPQQQWAEVQQKLFALTPDEINSDIVPNSPSTAESYPITATIGSAQQILYPFKPKWMKGKKTSNSIGVSSPYQQYSQQYQLQYEQQQYYQKQHNQQQQQQSNSQQSTISQNSSLVLPSIKQSNSSEIPSAQQDQIHQQEALVQQQLQVQYQLSNKKNSDEQKSEIQVLKQQQQPQQLDEQTGIQVRTLTPPDSRENGGKFVPIASAKWIGVDQIHDSKAVNKFLVVFFERLGVSSSRTVSAGLFANVNCVCDYSNENFDFALGQFLILANVTMRFIENNPSNGSHTHEIFRLFDKKRNSLSIPVASSNSTVSHSNSSTDSIPKEELIIQKTQDLFTNRIHVKINELKECYSLQFNRFKEIGITNQIIKYIKGGNIKQQLATGTTNTTIAEEQSLNSHRESEQLIFWRDYLRFKALIIDQKWRNAEDKVEFIMAIINHNEKESINFEYLCKLFACSNGNFTPQNVNGIEGLRSEIYLFGQSRKSVNSQEGVESTSKENEVGMVSTSSIKQIIQSRDFSYLNSIIQYIVTGTQE